MNIFDMLSYVYPLVVSFLCLVIYHLIFYKRGKQDSLKKDEGASQDISLMKKFLNENPMVFEDFILSNTSQEQLESWLIKKTQTDSSKKASLPLQKNEKLDEVKDSALEAPLPLQKSEKPDKVKDSVLEERDVEGRTELHLAALDGDIREVERLIKMGFDVNSKDYDGWTPVHYAAYEEYIDVTKLLIESGGDVNIANNTGNTPLEWTQRYYPNTYKEIIKLLEQLQQ